MCSVCSENKTALMTNAGNRILQQFPALSLFHKQNPAGIAIQPKGQPDVPTFQHIPRLRDRLREGNRHLFHRLCGNIDCKRQQLWRAGQIGVAVIADSDLFMIGPSVVRPIGHPFRLFDGERAEDLPYPAHQLQRMVNLIRPGQDAVQDGAGQRLFEGPQGTVLIGDELHRARPWFRPRYSARK